MNPKISINLDLLRLLAAISVFITHFFQLALDSSALEPLGRIGVITFFIISGYVIAHTATTKNTCLGDYLIARSSRLYSVFVPALLLTIIFDQVGYFFNPEKYIGIIRNGFIETISFFPFFITFTYENSFFSLRWSSNGPMWSIAYEFWYYVIFGCWFYLKGTFRIPVIFLCIFIAGYKIILLFPIWLCGVLLYKNLHVFDGLHHILKISVFVVSITILGIYLIPDNYNELHHLRTHFDFFLGHNFSSSFVTDYILSIPILIIMVNALTFKYLLYKKISRFIQIGAKSSFSLYLLHVPMILFFSSMIRNQTMNLWQSILTISIIIVFCLYFTLHTDKFKFILKNYLAKIFIFLKGN